MMQYNPLLVLRRLIVYQNGRSVYDQAFTEGVNIIRGHNGSGKTTITDFIYHSLGGEVAVWREEAKACDETLAEVEVNGQLLTLRRTIEGGKQMRPMAIYWGDIAGALKTASEGWEVYPFAASPKKESFSQILFRALGLPEVQGELSSRVTMHQILRLMYVDQVTQYNEIFRTDNFDRALLREAVGDLLCGSYDARLYDLQLALNVKTVELLALDNRLNGMLSILDSADQAVTAAMIREQVEHKRSERNRLHERLLSPGASPLPEEASAEAALRELNEQIASFTRALLTVERDVEATEFQITDAGRFLEALYINLASLDDASAVREVLGGMRFQFCPACYAIVSQDPDGKSCHLCHTPPDVEKGKTHLLRMRQEIAQQIKESELLQADRLRRLESLRSHLPVQRERLAQLQLRYRELAAEQTGATDPAIAQLHRAIGYTDRELEDLMRRLTLVEMLDSIRAERADAATQIARLKQEIDDRQKVQFVRGRDASALIATLTADLLKRDLTREADFRDVDSVTFDFGNNRLLANGRANYAASSMVYLKNCFHLALLLASTQADYFRYPRFALFDNIEDKGMEPARSHNFQQIVVAESERAKVRHQIIMTTSMIDPELEKSKHTRGPAYTPDRKTLQLD